MGQEVRNSSLQNFWQTMLCAQQKAHLHAKMALNFDLKLY
ncbi:hypothetical protein CAMGR0001_0665 [Campylobacter gracilis RM3268]|uniref:Uncharacterized protein n=1 Tax=Campylobacter gracilis RM3268 TaxID=553220 RepID=C8PDV9_9BACT|nr:hypothetical protein CAMGR0001_0665 [Campylobacter gracilis RM3268]